MVSLGIAPSLAVICGGLAIALLVPLIFSDQFLAAVQEASRMTFRFNSMFEQGREADQRLFTRYWLSTTRVRRRGHNLEERLDVVGQKLAAIRQLTGANTLSHIAALQAAGSLVAEIAERGWVVARPDVATRIYDSAELLGILSESILGEKILDEMELNKLANQHPVDLEQLVEVLLLVVELLAIRMKGDACILNSPYRAARPVVA